MIDLVDILKLSGFDPDLRTKLVRHKDGRYPIDVLRQQGLLERYQSFQSKPVFHDANQIVSFYGLPGTHAGFYGVYKVLNHRPTSNKERSSEEWANSKFFYDLKPDPRFMDLRDRLIIDWGLGTRSWYQNLNKMKPKPVVEIQAPGRKLPPFTDYLEFSLTYAQLKELFENEIAHRDWHSSLSAVAGIYLIHAKGCDKLYIGSAYGTGGIWGRWQNYAKSRHGGNIQLQELINGDPGVYPEQFVFSILQILPKTMTRDEVLKRETIYKSKLGTRATGLNSN